VIFDGHHAHKPYKNKPTQNCSVMALGSATLLLLWLYISKPKHVNNISFIYLFSKISQKNVTTKYLNLPLQLLTFHNILYGSLFLVSL
jgi:hypothetical protein